MALVKALNNAQARKLLKNGFLAIRLGYENIKNFQTMLSSLCTWTDALWKCSGP